MKAEPKLISSCEVCGNERLTSVLNLGTHPMCDDLVPLHDDRRCEEYPIEILFCEICRTAHQRYQVPKQELFPRSYHYRSRFTADVLSGMLRLVESCEQRFGTLAGKRVLDIGCNDGSLLNFFRDRGAIGIGIEPTDASLDAKRHGHVVFERYLSEDLASEVVAAHGNPDLIVFTNVFAHIENLLEVLNCLRRLSSQHTVLVIENHYLGSVLDANQFDTFYHEHPRTYSYSSFLRIAHALGVSLFDVEFPSRYGGNIRVFLKQFSEDDPREMESHELLAREAGFRARFDTMNASILKWVEHKKALIATEVKKHGRLRAKAFPGRAAILVKLLQLDTESVSAVYEKPGSMKIGHYVPGTRIPILSDEELFSLSDKSKPLLNFAWHIPDEIRSYVAQHDYTGPVIDIVGSADFVAA